MANSAITLYNGTTGTSTLVDAGDGGGASRMKSWLEEVPRWLKASVEPVALKGLGLGKLANFPSFLAGEDIPNFEGVSIWKVVHNTAVLATGDGADVTFGNDVLTQPDRTHADYYNTSTDPDDAVAPVGASAPAFLQSIADGGGINLAAVAGVIELIVNGTTYSVNVGVATATTAEIIRTAVHAANVPVDVAIEAGDTIRLLTLNDGIGSTISVVTSATALLIFTGAAQSSQVTTVYRGDNGPLNVTDNTEVVSGGKPQRRILPGSVTVTATVGAATVTMSDNGAGVLVDLLGVDAGTIAYATGIITLTYAVAPDNATSVTAQWKVLKVLDLTLPARIPVGGLELAITVNS